MFEDRVIDTILEEMTEAMAASLAEKGIQIRTDESSLAYNACARIAEKLEEVYGDMDEINDNISPNTMDDAHLIEYGAERGLTYREATYPVVRAKFNQPIDIGERLTCNDYTYEVTGEEEGYTRLLTCETEGAAANLTTGELEPVDYIDEYEGGEIVEVVTPGQEEEDIESFRQKIYDTFRVIAFCGNKADYRQFVDAIDGVPACKPIRRAEGSRWIYIYILGEGYRAPTAQLVSTVQEAVDPEQNHGEGDGMAPFNHSVRVLAAEEQTMQVGLTVKLDTGYTIESCTDGITEAVETYMESLRKAWERSEKDSTVVRIRQIENAVINTEGVLDVVATINGSESNAAVPYTKVPVLGGVTIV